MIMKLVMQNTWISTSARLSLIPACAVASMLAATCAHAEELRWSSAGLTLFRSPEGKQGLERVEWKNGMDSHTVVVPATYDWIERPGDANQTSFVVMRGMRYGLVDNTGRVLIEPQYDFVDNCEYGEAQVIQSALTGIADCATGKLIVPIEYQTVLGFFGKPLSPAVTDGKYGVVDRTGRVIVPFEKYYTATVGRFTKAYTAEKGPSATYDETGKVWFNRALPIEADYGEVLSYRGSSGKLGLETTISHDTLLDDAPGYDRIDCDADLMCTFGNGEANGLYNVKLHKIVIPLQPGYVFKVDEFWHAGTTRDPASGKGTGQSLYDRTGRAMFGQVFDEVHHADAGRITVRKGWKWGIIDRTGKMIIPLEILGNARGNGAAVNFLIDGRIEAAKESGTGITDRDGKTLIPFRYTDWVFDRIGKEVFTDSSGGYPFEKGSLASVHDASVAEPHPAGLMRGDGAWIIPLGRYDAIDLPEEFHGRQVVVVGKREGRSTRKGVYDITNGRELLPPVYEHVNIGSDSIFLRRPGGRQGYLADEAAGAKFFDGIDVQSVDLNLGLIETSLPAVSQFSSERGLIRLNGQEVIPDTPYLSAVFDYEDSSKTKNPEYDRYWAIQGGKLGMLDLGGRAVIHFRYDTQFNETFGIWSPVDHGAEKHYGLYNVRLNGEALLLDPQGNVIVRGRDMGLSGVSRIRKYDIGNRMVYLGEQFAPGRTSSTDDPTSFTMLIDGKLYTEVSGMQNPWIHFPNGLISAKRNGKYGFLDRNGKEAIPFIYDEVDAFGRSFTFVRTGTEWSMINRLGQPVSFFSPGMAIRKRRPITQ